MTLTLRNGSTIATAPRVLAGVPALALLGLLPEVERRRPLEGGPPDAALLWAMWEQLMREHDAARAYGYPPRDDSDEAIEVVWRAVLLRAGNL